MTGSGHPERHLTVSRAGPVHDVARTLACGQCGATVTAADDDALAEAAKQHFREQHPFLPVSDDKLRSIIAEKARDS